MLSFDRFMQGVFDNIDRVHEYKAGCDGTNGKCDCIGLIIGAVRLAGGAWDGTHGSNYAMRHEITDTIGITGAGDLSIGDIVFKAYEPGDKNWRLPDTYKNDIDQRDYYHVGIVTRTNPLEITHCTSVSGGIKRDNRVGQWKFAGKLRLVDYNSDGAEPGRDDEHMCNEQWRVKGGTLNLRSKPFTTAQRITGIPNGT